jgi:hypothetical protein
MLARPHEEWSGDRLDMIIMLLVNTNPLDHYEWGKAEGQNE